MKELECELKEGDVISSTVCTMQKAHVVSAYGRGSVRLYCGRYMGYSEIKMGIMIPTMSICRVCASASKRIEAIKHKLEKTSDGASDTD